jgi:peptidoglycan-associated lipoprotein
MIHASRLQCVLASMRMRSLGTWHRHCLSMSLILTFTATCGKAQADLTRFRLRASAGMGAMISDDQLGRMAFDKLGFLGDLQAGYAMLPYLEVQAGMLGGVFLSAPPDEAGGLLAPVAGFRVTLPNDSARPYLHVGAGAGFTGELVRPVLSAGIGVDLQLTRTLALGPMLGYGQVVQRSGPNQSTDAKFIWLGLSLSYRPVQPDEPPADDTPPPPRRSSPAPTVPPPPRPPAPATPVEPSPEILALIERTLPDPRRDELLALVLFEFDSDILEPMGVAMLHEVARVLQQRPEIQLVEIQGYADSRGSLDYNHALSARRAQRVRDWLVEHGVAEARLQVSAVGAVDFVEPGTDDQAHEQNRRVVFRVLKMEAP